MQGLRPVFTCMQSLFQPRVGASFGCWEVDWSGHGRFQVCYRRLHALALEPEATVQTVWDAGWFPSLPRTLSDQRYAHLITLHTAIVPRQLLERDPDAWVWSGGRFSIRALYRHFQILESTSNSPTLSQMLSSIMEVSNYIECQTVQMVAPTSKTDDAIPPVEVLPGRTGGVSFVRRSC